MNLQRSNEMVIKDKTPWWRADCRGWHPLPANQPSPASDQLATTDLNIIELEVHHVERADDAGLQDRRKNGCRAGLYTAQWTIISRHTTPTHPHGMLLYGVPRRDTNANASVNIAPTRGAAIAPSSMSSSILMVDEPPPETMTSAYQTHVSKMLQTVTNISRHLTSGFPFNRN
ncbi:hypothetical protein HIM_06855 [Hirsutella minnesotensis 3608]|uniref:Uncharacterized protein n=1 Tax=Hirsutella minnesotensis 3608 TaxID=1043627 RepID=A0A0F7ZZ76_9HYPO|nr:hypothetical protein HIM_06855 [Hirsutella minnesotensis 3608]